MGSANIKSNFQIMVVDGKEYNFVFTNRSMEYLKEKYGSFTKACTVADENGEIDVAKIVDLVFSGLMINENLPDFESVRNHVLDMPIWETKELAQIGIPNAMNKSMPEADPKK
jgi:hypothetical protein